MDYYDEEYREALKGMSVTKGQDCRCKKCRGETPTYKEDGMSVSHEAHCRVQGEASTTARGFDGDQAKTKIQIKCSEFQKLETTLADRGHSQELELELTGTDETKGLGHVLKEVGEYLLKDIKFHKCQCQGHVYIIRAGDTNRYKIGYTSKHPSKRMKQLQTANALPLSLVSYWEAPGRLETEIHSLFEESRLKGEWFELSTDQVLEALPKITELLG